MKVGLIIAVMSAFLLALPVAFGLTGSDFLTWHTFDDTEFNGTHSLDIINNYDAFLTNISTGKQGIVDEAYRFSYFDKVLNNNSVFNITHDEVFNVSTDDNFTIGIWFQIAVVNLYDFTLWSKHNQAGNKGVRLYYNDATGQLDATTRTGACSDNTRPAIAWDSADNESKWYCFVFIHNTVDNKSVWINGTEVSSYSFNTNNCAGDYSVEEPLYIGWDETMGVDYFNGTVDEFFWSNKAFTGAEVQEYCNGIQPPFQAPVVTIESPSSGVRDNVDPTNFTFNVTDTDNATVSCDLYIGGVNNATNSSVVNATTTQFSVSMSENSHTWYINCSDMVNIGLSDTYTYIADYTEPFLNSVSPVLANTTLYTNYNMTLVGNLTDDSLYRVNRTIYYPNGSIYYSNYSGDLAVNTTVYSWDITFNTTLEPNGNYEYFIQATDSHTKKYFPDAKQVKVDNSERKLSYEFDEGYINVSLVGGNVFGQFESISTTKITDRYTFELNFKSTINPNSIMVFRVQAEEPMKYLSGSQYNGHMILYDKYWVDFMGVEGQYDVSCVDYYNEEACYSYDVEIITANGNDKFVFNSLGGVNEAEYEITFEVNNCVTAWSCSDYGSCNASDLAPCNDTIDLNVCGLPYGGDYSEFTAQACSYCVPTQTLTYDRSLCTTPQSYYNTSILNTNFATCCNITQLASDCYCSQNSTTVTGLPSFYIAYCQFDTYQSHINETTWHLLGQCGYEQIYGAEDIKEMVYDLFGGGINSLANWVPLLVIGFFISAFVTILVYRKKWGKK